MNLKKNPLARLIAYAFLGSVAGFINGLIFSSLIILVIAIGNPEVWADDFCTVVQFLGMGLGVAIGGVFGGIVSIRK